MVRVLIGLLFVLPVGTAHSGEFRTTNPLKAFIHSEYPLGSDYFIKGTEDTYVFRCILTKEKEGFEGIALSEISIWGNRMGPWEIFRKGKGGGLIYAGTKELTDTSCLESCRSKEYLVSGQCQWQYGCPKQ
jgi:hypothetical protein